MRKIQSKIRYVMLLTIICQIFLFVNAADKGKTIKEIIDGNPLKKLQIEIKVKEADTTNFWKSIIADVKLGSDKPKAKPPYTSGKYFMKEIPTHYKKNPDGKIKT